MFLALTRSLHLLALAATLGAVSAPARALVGAEPDSRFADRVAMVLIRGGDKAGFCSALVLSPRVLLTAAHCLRPLRDMAVYYRDAAGTAVIIPVDAAIAMAESSGRQFATGGVGERGYWQINPDHGSLSTYDPLGNAKAAVIISAGGTNWTPWTTFTSGAYLGRC